MTRGRQASRRDGIAHWLLPASVLHVAGVLLAAVLSPGAGLSERATPSLDSVQPESSVELALLYDGQWWVPSGTASPPADPFEATPPRDDPRAPLGPSRPGDARSDSEALARRGSASLELTRRATPSPAGRDAPPASPPADSPSPADSPKLSLEQLGVGTHPFLDIGGEPLTTAEQANSRLQAALQARSPAHDRRRSVGPAGPVADAARRLVLADESLVETSAVLNVRVDGTGHVTEVHVLESSSQSNSWRGIATRLAQALHLAPLRRADSKRGWDMKLRLASSVRLPSGSAPGMRVGVLGQQVAGSGGPGSTSIELSPTSKLDLEEPIDSVGRHLDSPMRFEVMLLKLRADPVDLGATARRVVEVALLSIDEPTTP